MESLLLDSLYFRLRLNPLLAYNNDYHEMADTAWVEYDDDFMMQLQIQLRRFLEDDLAWQFSVEEKPFVLQSGESIRVLLGRLARQDAAIRVLKRLHIRGDYAGVLKYADIIRKHAETLHGDERAFHSWNHTVTRSEICIYESYARIYFAGKEAVEATDDLKTAAKELERALQKPDDAGLEEPFRENHPARVRILRLAGIAYLYLGYAYASRGRFGDALSAYAAALPHLRAARFAPMQAMCMYSMARVLAERGHTLRATRICNDAMTMLDERGRGGTRPYGLAQNTLALVYNRGHEPSVSWREAAVAHACFERVSDKRDLGLAKLQIGEALRRLGGAYPRPPHSRTHETILEVYKLSETYLRDALSIFTDEAGVSSEVLRQMEAYNELGSSLREQGHYLATWLQEKDQDHGAADIDRRRMERLLNEASACFMEALQLAQEKQHGIQELDALWGIAKVAYTRYRIHSDQGFEKAAIAACQQMRAEVERLQLLAPQSVIARDNQAPAAATTEPTVLRLLSHVYELLARIYFVRFERHAQAVRVAKHREIPYVERMSEAQRRAVQQAILENHEAAESLLQAIDFYMVAIGYSYLYSSAQQDRVGYL